MSAPGWLTDLGALIVTFGLTGWLLGLVFVPAGLTGARRLWLSLALAIPATTLVALPGLLAHALVPATLALSAGALLTAAGWRCLRDGRRPSRPRTRRAITSMQVLGLCSAGAVAWFVVVGPQVEANPNPWPNGLSLYYWQLVQETVRAGYFPATLGEWGAPRPFPFEYLVTTVHGAATAIVAGNAELALQERYRVAVLVLTLLASFALLRRWLPAWWAFIAATLGVSGVYLLTKLSSYRPETFGLTLVLWSGWFLDEGCERRSWGWAAMAGVLAASAFLAHGSVWLMCAPLWLAILTGRFARRPTRPTAPVRIASVLAATARSQPLRLLAAGGVAFLLAIAVVSGGTGTASRLAGVFTGQGGEKAATAGADPTWALYYAATYDAAGLPANPPDTCGKALRLRTVRLPWERLDMFSPLTQAALGLGVLSVVVLRPRTRRPVGRLVLAAAVFALMTYAVTASLCAAYTNYVPSRAGPTRILPYYAFAVAMVLALFGWLLSDGASRAVSRWRASGRSRLAGALRPRAVGLVATGVLSAALLVGLTPVGGTDRDEEGPGRLSPVGGEAYSWMEERLPADAIVMANGFTAGSLGAVSDRTGWLDGRVPYLESPQWRDQATRSLEQARAYFSDPTEHRDALPGAVDYLLVAGTGVNLGGQQFRTDYEALRREPYLRLVRSFDDAQITLYEVEGRRPGSGVASEPTSAPPG